MPNPALLAVALVLALAGGAVAADLRVVRVSDGDTFTGLDAENRQVKVRLHGIDAPEAKQPFGNVSKQALSDLIAGKTVSVEEVDRDRYGRVVGRVTIGGKLVNAEQVRAGLAWRYVQFDRRNEFGGLEADARRQRRGLWADAAPVAPGSGGRRRRSGRRPRRPWEREGRFGFPVPANHTLLNSRSPQTDVNLAG
jgi:micrococcal nuclease